MQTKEHSKKSDKTSVIDDKIILHISSKEGRLQRDDVKMYELLFENLLDVFFYIKDVDGLWVSCNTASLELLNLTKISDVIGIKEESFFPKQIAKDIRADDLSILSNGQSVLNRVELITNQHGELIWVNTNKLPIFDKDENVIGLVGVTKPIEGKVPFPQKYSLLNDVVSHINTNLSKVVLISELAEMMSLSESQFRRRFQNELGVTPKQFILRARLQASANMFRSKNKQISVVALECGFSDQSYFTRQFKQFFGKTPKAYQKQWR